MTLTDQEKALLALGRHPLSRAESEAEALTIVRVAQAIGRERQELERLLNRVRELAPSAVKAAESEYKV